VNPTAALVPISEPFEKAIDWLLLSTVTASAGPPASKIEAAITGTQIAELIRGLTAKNPDFNVYS
jgi:hypothetical protein